MREADEGTDRLDGGRKVTDEIQARIEAIEARMRERFGPGAGQRFREQADYLRVRREEWLRRRATRPLVAPRIDDPPSG